jgi:hypothetical protein
MNSNWGYTYSNGFVVLAEDFDMFRLGDIATGGLMILSGSLFFIRKGLWLN